MAVFDSSILLLTDSHKISSTNHFVYLINVFLIVYSNIIVLLQIHAVIQKDLLKSSVH